MSSGGFILIFLCLLAKYVLKWKICMINSFVFMNANYESLRELPPAREDFIVPIPGTREGQEELGFLKQKVKGILWAVAYPCKVSNPTIWHIWRRLNIFI